MKYNINHEIIPQSERKAVNEKLLYLIENNLFEQFGLTKTDIFNAFTGEGGLHGLNFKEYDSFHHYTKAKKEIENGQFFTPHLLAKFLIDCLKPNKHDLVADLTCGMGNFFNYMPNEVNVYGNELDIKAYKVARFLYPDANITNQDIRLYSPEISFDIVLGNPPFNLRWKVDNNEYLSQLYYCMKSYDLMNPGGIMALIVPKSFLNDDFSDGGMINEIEQKFNFICQFLLPVDSFKHNGVNHYETKIMIFQKKSEHIAEKPFDMSFVDVEINEKGSAFVYQSFIAPLLDEKQKARLQLTLEIANGNQDDKDFRYKVNKLLFDIKRNPKIEKYYSKCKQYVSRYYTQTIPEGMDYSEWQKSKVTKNKVIRYLKNTLNKQHPKAEKEMTKLVKTRYGLKLKAYSRKQQMYLNRLNSTKEITFNQMLYQDQYPFTDRTYAKLYAKKKKQLQQQSRPFSEVRPDKTVTEFLDHLVIHDSENREEIRLNDIQKQDTAKMLCKNFGYLQWGTGSGKSISAVAQMLYRMQFNNVRNIFLIAPAIAINNNWNDILKSYGFNFLRINSLKDIRAIQKGQIVIMTFNMLVKYERFIKRYIKMQGQKVMLVLDEADSIANPSSKRTMAVLNCFRRIKYKLLTSATSTRNNIPESFTAFELLYNNSYNMLCEARSLFVEDKQIKEITKKDNEKYYLKPFPPYKKGNTLFKRCFSPEKATVFGIGKQNQDIYNSEHLKELINKTMITRTFEDVAGKDIYEIKQGICSFNDHEKELYSIIIKEFYRLSYMYKSTGNARKDSLLKIINQLNSLLKACVIPNTFKEYKSSQMPSKARQMLSKLDEWENERVAIGCTHIKTVNIYARYIQERFPGRPLFIITGDKVTLNKRKEIIRQLKASKNGILICTQQSLSSSMNIDFINRVLLLELQWNFAAMHQFFARFVRYTSTEQKEIHFLTVENSVESNLLKLVMTKEKLNSFMKNDDLSEDEIQQRFGIDFDLLNMLLTKEHDEQGNSYISWGNQLVS